MLLNFLKIKIMNTELIEETDLRIAKAVCEFAYANSKPNVMLVKSILSMISGVSLEKLDSTSRKREIVNPRQVGMWYYAKIKDRGNYLCTLASIGEAFGDKDHATVIHARREVENKLSINDPLFKSLVRQLREHLLRLNKDFIV